MNELIEHERMMTVKEVADICKVSYKTIQYYIRKLYPGLMHPGITTYLNEEQVETIKRHTESTRYTGNVEVPINSILERRIYEIGVSRYNENSKRMTVKEVADVLGVTRYDIQYHIRKLFPYIMRQGKTTYLSEDQIYIIKKHMKKTDAVRNSITELDVIEMEYIKKECLKAKYGHNGTVISYYKEIENNHQ
jgi:transcriptional antiterminator